MKKSELFKSLNFKHYEGCNLWASHTYDNGDVVEYTIIVNEEAEEYKCSAFLVCPTGDLLSIKKVYLTLASASASLNALHSNCIINGTSHEFEWGDWAKEKKYYEYD
jgi:hypothetical protein|tara:strand:+ start:452 stop:772 length:321 start_codon:yes stop_codon:yes gene_type:complete